MGVGSEADRHTKHSPHQAAHHAKPTNAQGVFPFHPTVFGRAAPQQRKGGYKICFPPRGVNKNGERTEHRSFVIHGGNEGNQTGRKEEKASKVSLPPPSRDGKGERLAFLPGKIKNGGGVACKVSSRQTAERRTEGGESKKKKSGAVLRNKSCPDDEGRTSEAERRARQKRGALEEGTRDSGAAQPKGQGPGRFHEID